jgi:chemosensory pili system protein ChpA (sensor histidine kinase/response regulator)
MSAILKYDTGPLNWVRNDIEAALQAALGRVQAFTADADLTNALRLARDDAHQVMGALRMVGLEGAATVASALEVTLADIHEGRHASSDEVLRAIRNTIEGLSRWIKELAEGRGSGELALFPLYRRLRELQGAERVFEGELFFPDLRSRVHGIPRAVEQSSDALSAQIKTARSMFQRGLLAFLRGQGTAQGLQHMRQALAEVEKVAPSQAAQTFWWACVGFVDSLIAQGVEADFHVKQLLARIDLQMRRLMEGSPQVAERLLRDALFFVAKSQPLEGRAAEVRATFSLDQYLPGKGLLDPETLARMRPVLASLKTGLKSARDLWHAHVENATAGQNEGFQTQLGRMQDQAVLVGAEELPLLLRQLSDAAAVSTRLGAAQQEQLNLEIAATLLFLQNAVESEEVLRADFSIRASNQGERLLALSEGRDLPQAEALLDTQSQAVAERELLHHLALEVSSNLKQIEDALDLFFRDAAQREGLVQLAPLGGQARGALIMLELHDAAELLGAAMKAVEKYTIEGYPADDIKDHIADAFSSLGLYIEAYCAGRSDAARILQPVMAGFGLSTTEMVPESDADDSIEAGLGARKFAVASAYVAWRDEGGEEASKKFLEILIELGRDAELIADAVLKHDVDTLLAASRAAVSPHADLDNQVSQLTQVNLAPVADLTDQNTPLDTLEIDAGVDTYEPVHFDLPTFELPAMDTASIKEAALPSADAAFEMADLEPHEVAASETHPSPAAELEAVPNAGPDKILAIVPADSDGELLEIFLEEANEVLTAIADAIATSTTQPDESENLTVIRRAFHTLKGSGRMVGLTDLGEAAWGMEQFLNSWLAENKPANPAFLNLMSDARQLFQEWVHALQSDQPVALAVSALLAGTLRVAQGLPYPGTELNDVELTPAPDASPSQALVTETAQTETEEFILAAHPELTDPIEQPFDQPDSLVSPGHETDIPEQVTAYEGLEIASAETGIDLFAAESAEPIASEAEADMVVGNVRLSPGLFDIFMTEAHQRLTSLQDEMLRLSDAETSPISETAQRAIHTLGGIAGTAGFNSLAVLAHALELYWHRFEFTPMPVAHHALVTDIVQHMQEMLAQIAIFVVPDSGNDLIAALGELQDEQAVNLATLVHQDDIVEILALPEYVEAPESAVEALAPDDFTPAESIIEAPEPAEQFVAVIEYAASVIQVELTEPEQVAIAGPEELQAVSAVQITGLEHTEPEHNEPEHTTLEPRDVEHSDFEHPELAHSDPQPSEFKPGKLDLTDLIPETPQKVAAPLFERRDVADEIDQQLLPIFMEEAEALVPETSEQLRLWKTQPKNQSALDILRRNLHTLKGSARMVGAMRLGELTHVMESRIIAIGEGQAEAGAADFDALEAQMDRLALTVENLKRGGTIEPEAPAEDGPLELTASPSNEISTSAPDEASTAAQPILRDAQALTLRVRADWVDRMVNQAGEVAIARSRIESEVFNFKRHVGELSEALIRLRGHIREVEIQAESQMQSTFITQGQGEHFDPLEFDRFTRFQEVTRFLAESVNDISTVHHILLARLGEADAALLHQTRLNRELQQNLLRVRMVPMYSVAERLYRTVRQTARDVDKRAQLDIQGGDLEIDRSVLEKVTAPLEHLLRNALAHGIESAETRKAAGKTEFGEITLSAQQSGNEMLLIVKDDGAGLNFDRIREKAMAQGMLTPGIEPSEAQLAQMIFAAGFSTAEKVSEVSGRGVGMDVVKSEIAALGGRIDISSTKGGGTQFSIYLPLTLAMTQAVMFSAGKQDYALPTTLVQQVLELKPEPLAAALAAGEIEWRGAHYPLTYLPHLLGYTDAVHEVLIFNRVVLLKSGNSQAAILVDSIEGTREIVVKNIGPQLARVTGIAGATVRGDGRVILILNPVPLALRWMSQPKETRENIASHVLDAPETQLAPLVLVVDDSLTVRKITGRLLTREGYRMDTAKDGVDALEKMHDLIPDVVLLDVEMPRMDGFELARVMRNDPRLKRVPIIMITSRTAEKHRNHALELGVNLYMGKPYQEQQLLDGIGSLVTKNVTA